MGLHDTQSATIIYVSANRAQMAGGGRPPFDNLQFTINMVATTKYIILLKCFMCFMCDSH